MLDEIVEEVRGKAPKIYEKAVAAAAACDKPKLRKRDFERFGIAVFTRTGELLKAAM